MCGIAGWLDWKKDLRQEDAVRILQKMTETLTHRGPDAGGTWSAHHVGLGHRRLIVLDPRGGAQPMTCTHEGRTYTITYNGELYNYLELRSQLQVRGHQFATRNSDTEVLLHAYIEWGAACTDRLNGIFAFAIWDEHRQSLFLCRDRLGVKPLFYRQTPDGLMFASELKALLAHPEVPAQLDREGLGEIMVMGPSRTPGHGVFRGLQELRPGFSLLGSRERVKMWPYWNLKSHPHRDGLKTTAATVRGLLEDTAARQLQSDVPVCTLLSGGLDSSILTALAARTLQHEPLHTFSVDYVDSSRYFIANQFETNPDGPWIERVSEHLGTVHHHIIIDNQELARSLVPALQASDLPGMTDIDSSLLLFCREIKKQATVALSGECADEIFGGYPWFHKPETAGTTGFPWIRQVKERSRFLSPALQDLIRPVDYAWQRFQEAREEVPRLPGEAAEDARIRELFYLNMTRFMTTLLDRKDRMSMAGGLEVRVPYSDHRLVEYVWNIPWTMKTAGGQAKGVLRQAMQGLLPQDVLWREKSPYPKSHHPLYRQSIKAELEQVLQDSSSPLLPLIQPQAVADLLQRDEPLMGQPWFGQLMGDTQYMAYLLQINRWLKHYRISVH